MRTYSLKEVLDRIGSEEQQKRNTRIGMMHTMLYAPKVSTNRIGIVLPVVEGVLGGSDGIFLRQYDAGMIHVGIPGVTETQIKQMLEILKTWFEGQGNWNITMRSWIENLIADIWKLRPRSTYAKPPKMESIK